MSFSPGVCREENIELHIIYFNDFRQVCGDKYFETYLLLSVDAASKTSTRYLFYPCNIDRIRFSISIVMTDPIKMNADEIIPLR